MPMLLSGGDPCLYLPMVSPASWWLAAGAVIIAVSAYFLGCFNGAVIVSKYILRDDVRSHGSGNAGLTTSPYIGGR